jgi:hypothetical protein
MLSTGLVGGFVMMFWLGFGFVAFVWLGWYH